MDSLLKVLCWTCFCYQTILKKLHLKKSGNKWHIKYKLYYQTQVFCKSSIWFLSWKFPQKFGFNFLVLPPLLKWEKNLSTVIFQIMYFQPWIQCWGRCVLAGPYSAEHAPQKLGCGFPGIKLSCQDQFVIFSVTSPTSLPLSCWWLSSVVPSWPYRLPGSNPLPAKIINITHFQISTNFAVYACS